MIGVYAINGFHAPIDRCHDPKSVQLIFFLENLLDDPAQSLKLLRITLSLPLKHS